MTEPRDLKLLHGAGAALTLQVLGLGMSYTTNVVLARAMGASQYGIYAFVLSTIIILTTLAETAFPDLMVRYIPAYESSEQWPYLRGLIRRGRSIATGAGVLIAIIGAALLYTSILAVRDDYRIPLMVGLWVVPVWANMRLFTFAARSFGRIVEAYLPPRILRPSGMLAAAILFAVAGWRLTGTLAALCMLISLLLIVGLQWALFVRNAPPPLFWAAPGFKMREWLRAGFPLWVAVGFTVLEKEIGILIIGTLLPPDQAGLYAVAMRISQIVDFPVIAVETMSLPMFARLYAQKRPDELREVLGKAVRWSLAAALIVTVLVVIAVVPILSLFGSEFLSAKRVTILLALRALLGTAMGPALGLLKVTNYQKESMVIAGWTTVTSIVLTTGGVSLWGVMGAAAASVVTVIISGVYQNIVTIKRLAVFPAVIFQLFPGMRKEHDTGQG